MRLLLSFYFIFLAVSINTAEASQALEATSVPKAIDFKTTKACSLPSDEAITVACTYNCNRWIKRALYKFARKLGYKVEVVNIFSENSTPDISRIDAFLFPGGADINPSYYSSHVDEALRKRLKELEPLVNFTDEGAKRDPFESALLESYFSSARHSQTPILGICRGMQMLGVSQKVPLYIDIKEELNIRNRRWTIDRVQVKVPESVIQETLGKSRFWGVEYHHQGLRLDYFNQHRDRWPHLDITAVSNGGQIAEVLEFYNRPILGVQFHPEWTFGKVRRGVFSWLLNRACHKKRNDMKENLFEMN